MIKLDTDMINKNHVLFRTINLLNKYKASMESTAEMEEQIREHQFKYEKCVQYTIIFETA